jgi:diaminohydroxyphosphoribosylaminopyrimidine deaminase/5-amino-6-(5-phosphoribosylamino)uracil reductase
MRLLTGRPLFHLKLATSLDGRIATAPATANGSRARPRGPTASAFARTHEAILVGANTVAPTIPS